MCEGPYECPDAKEFSCNECDAEWVEPDTNFIRCPECNSKNTTLHRCPECPVAKLAEVRSTSDAGKLLELVLDLDNTLDTYKVDWNEVPAEQAIGLRILREERDKHRVELEERNRREQQH